MTDLSKAFRVNSIQEANRVLGQLRSVAEKLALELGAAMDKECHECSRIHRCHKYLWFEWECWDDEKSRCLNKILTPAPPIPEADQKMTKVVCLCGSTRFSEAFAKAQLELTLAGVIVLTIGCNMRTDAEIFGHLSPEQQKQIKAKLDELHLRKIDLADEVLILNVGKYVGDSTKSEIQYAQKLGKTIRWLEPPI